MNNVVEKFKKGSKIHIKESQKGSFTKWCGGNVTSECIQKGKNSSNPKIRKKATFAQNARHFKHHLGGQIVQGGFIKSANARKWKEMKKKFQFGGFINPAMAAIPYMNPYMNSNDSYMNPNANAGSIVQGYYNNLLNQEFNSQMNKQKQLQKLELEKLKIQKQNQILNTITNLGSTLLTNYLNSKAVSPNQPPSVNENSQK